MGLSPYFLMYRRQPHLPIDVTLGLAPKAVTTPTSFKYIQKLREHVRWANRKANQLHQKVVWYHKKNYIRCSRAVALREGDAVLVHVTTFKGRHRIQNQCENREYVVEWPAYPNLPVYVVCPRDGEGCSWTLHRNYLLPISNNVEQAGDEPINKLTVVPPADSGLLADGPTESQPESLPGSLKNSTNNVEQAEDEPINKLTVVTFVSIDDTTSVFVTGLNVMKNILGSQQEPSQRGLKNI